MIRFGRRRFIGVSVAAACVGCSDDDAAPPSTTASPVDPAEIPMPPADPLLLFGAPVQVGVLAEVRAAALSSPTYVPEARAWLVALTEDDAAIVSRAADERLRPGLEHGLLALSQKCPHLGCRVPYCDSSAWFECQCHGAMFTQAGEQRGGPSPRGLDAMVIAVDDDVVTIAPTELVTGAPGGTVVLDQPPSGPHCAGEAEH